LATYATPLDSRERVLADGRVAIPGELIEISAEDAKDEHNKRLIEEGQLVKVNPAKEKKEA
jgi:hypothetical protein